MKHRIYSFPLRAEEKQIHTQFTEEVPLRAQPDRRQGPSWGWGWGWQQQSQQSHSCLSWGAGQCRCRGLGKPALPGLGGEAMLADPGSLAGVGCGVCLGTSLF